MPGTRAADTGTLRTGDPKRPACLLEGPICREDPCVGHQCGSEQVRIDPADTSATELPALNQSQDLVVLGDREMWERAQQTHDLCTVAQGAERKLADHEWVSQHITSVEALGQEITPLSQVVDPDRRVDERHAAPDDRLRRADRRPRSLPPRAASLLALSRVMSASRPIRTRAVFWVMPVSRPASLSRAVSTLSVVLICIKMHSGCISVKTRGWRDLGSWGQPIRRAVGETIADSGAKDYRAPAAPGLPAR